MVIYRPHTGDRHPSYSQYAEWLVLRAGQCRQLASGDVEGEASARVAGHPHRQQEHWQSCGLVHASYGLPPSNWSANARTIQQSETLQRLVHLFNGEILDDEARRESQRGFFWQ